MQLIKKSDPTHPSWQPPVGLKVFEINGLTYYGNLTHVEGRLVSHLEIYQSETNWQVVSLILEGEEKRPATWTRRDRYGKKHQEKCPVNKGVCPLFRGGSVHLPTLLVSLFNRPQDLPKINPPKGGLIWEMCDCSMSQNPKRAESAIRIAKTKTEGVSDWDAFEIYAEYVLACFPSQPLLSDKDLEDLQNWDAYEAALAVAAKKRRSSQCAPATRGE